MSDAAQLAADTKLQTIEVGEETKGETKPRRAKKFPELVLYPFNEDGK